jgi:hypothetical protein
VQCSCSAQFLQELDLASHNPDLASAFMLWQQEKVTAHLLFGIFPLFIITLHIIIFST